VDESLLADCFSRFKVVVSIEEHGKIGGFGSAIAEWLAGRGTSRARLLSIGAPDEYLHESGGQKYARSRFGLTPDAISAQVISALSPKNQSPITNNQ
jgi:transketolase